MSGLSIASCFPFRRIKIIQQHVSADVSTAQIVSEPDKRFYPICHRCKEKASGIHSHAQRKIRDLDFGGIRVWIQSHYRKIICPRCQRILVEDLGLFHPSARVTNRMARYIYDLCRVMTVKEVTQHVGLNWKTVKQIEKEFLERDFGQPNYDGRRISAVDEISIRTGHNYLTVVLDYITGRVLFIGKHRKAKTLMRFFKPVKAQTTKSHRGSINGHVGPIYQSCQKETAQCQDRL